MHAHILHHGSITGSNDLPRCVRLYMQDLIVVKFVFHSVLWRVSPSRNIQCECRESYYSLIGRIFQVKAPELGLMSHNDSDWSEKCELAQIQAKKMPRHVGAIHQECFSSTRLKQ